MKIKSFIAFLLVVCFSFFNGVSANYIAIDPTRTIPNARVLALGKAFTALADDTGSIYTNPAGLADAANWQLTSMSGQFLSAYNYLSFSGFYPTDFGVLGLGFAGTSITGAWATTIEAGSDPDDPIYTIDPSQPQMGNQNNAFVLSYANQMNKIGYLSNLPGADNMTFGSNFKIFDVWLYGDGIVGGDGRGYELDLGVKYKPAQKWLKFGLALQNMLPTSMGGKLTYSAGHTESYPVVVEGGSAFKLLGENNGLYKIGQHELDLLVDFDMRPTLTNYPTCMHYGLEWKPVPMISVRAAIDQDAGDDGAGQLTTYNDLAYGVGLNLSGFSFDYAYHTFAGAPSIDNNYFSISYGLIPPPDIPEQPIIVSNPKDQHMTFDNKVKLSGQVLDKRIRLLTVNTIPIKFNLRGEFRTDVGLKYGKDIIMVEGRAKDGRRLAQEKIRVLRLEVFPDVADNYWVAEPISLMAMQKIISGYPDGSFKPDGFINRAEMCALLMKTRAREDVSANVEPIYKDVAANHWAAPYIAQANQLGIVQGYPDGTFRPGSKISRAEGLTMIARFAGIEKESYGNQFPDLARTHWSAATVSGAYRAGIIDYLIGRSFEPERVLTRAETVMMLYRTRIIQDLLQAGVLAWDSYE